MRDRATNGGRVAWMLAGWAVAATLGCGSVQKSAVTAPRARSSVGPSAGSSLPNSARTPAARARAAQKRRQAQEAKAPVPQFQRDPASEGQVWFGSELAARRSELGVLVGMVAPGSPADLAGIRAGDFIFQLDGRPLGNGSDLRTEVERVGVGGSLRLGVRRHSELRLFRVALAVRPSLPPSDDDVGERPTAQGEPLEDEELEPTRYE